ncbi:MAG: bacillithiol biosynthesis cysteine-adding enzyme BshC, partial [Bacteroidota bacterium]
MESIDYRRLPPLVGGFSELFLDFVYDFEKVHPFYVHDFRDPSCWKVVAKQLNGRSFDRATLVAALEEQNTAFGSPSRTFDHIALLKKPTTFAVVTGQQVGLFGGPLYTIYKTITAIKLVSHLKEILPAFDFVPVFWVEGEDHDFPEMNHIGVLDRENAIRRIEYLPGGSLPERNPGPVGEMVFDSSLDETMNRLTDSLRETEFSESVLSMLRGCYQKDRSFNQAFTRWMNFLFQEHGIVFISPHHRALKRTLSPLFEREIQEFPATSQMVISQSAELEKGYHAQIKAKSINLFLFHKGGRYLIEPRENDFSLRGTRHFLQVDELAGIAREQPELLSPNVVLRPLAQDSLLPTIAYVAGPSEIAYHAQLKPVYEHLEVIQPVLFPRVSASLIEGAQRRAMERYGLALVEFFDVPGKVVEKVLEQISDVGVDGIFTEANKRFGETLNELRFGLREIDPTLLGVLDGFSAKAVKGLENLKEKTSAAQRRKNEAAVRQIEKASSGLLPGGTLQE